MQRPSAPMACMRPLLILQTSRDRPPGFVAEFLARAGWPTISVLLERSQTAAARRLLDHCAGLLILDEGIHEDLPTDDRCLAAELIVTAWRSERGLCGLGSGARLLAATLGAAPPAERTGEAIAEIGWLPATLRPEAAASPWLARLGTPSQTVLLWHREPLAVPPGAIALLASPQSSCVAFAGLRLLGMHFHADLTPAGFAQWLALLREGLPAPAATVQSAAEIAAGYAGHVAGMREVATRMLTQWLDELSA